AVDRTNKPNVRRFLRIAWRLKPTVHADILLTGFICVGHVNLIMIFVRLGSDSYENAVGLTSVGVSNVPQSVDVSIAANIDPAKASVGRAIVDVRISTFDYAFNQYAFIGNTMRTVSGRDFIAQNVAEHANYVINL